MSVLFHCKDTSAVCGDIDKHSNHIPGEEHLLQLVYLCISYIGRTRNSIQLFSNDNLCLYKQNINYGCTFGYYVLSYNVLIVAILIFNTSGVWHHTAFLETSCEIQFGFH
jgi:hypothetical protein